MRKLLELFSFTLLRHKRTKISRESVTTIQMAVIFLNALLPQTIFLRTSEVQSIFDLNSRLTLDIDQLVFNVDNDMLLRFKRPNRKIKICRMRFFFFLETTQISIGVTSIKVLNLGPNSQARKRCNISHARFFYLKLKCCVSQTFEVNKFRYCISNWPYLSP